MPSPVSPAVSLLARLSLPALLLAVSLPSLAQLGLNLWHATPEQTGNPWLVPLSIHVGLMATLLAMVQRMRRALLLLAPAAFLAAPEIFYLLWFGQRSDAHLYGILLDTNYEEVTSWLGPWLLPSGLLLLLWAWAVLQLSRAWWHQDWRWTHRSRRWVLIAAGLLAGILGALHVYVAPILADARARDDDSVVTHSVNAGRIGVDRTIEDLFPWGLPLRWASFREHQVALARHSEALAGYDFGVRWPQGAAPQRQIQVLVIGETGRPDRWQLFGASRATTPKLAQRSDLILFTDAVSPASATRESVPLMLTQRPPADVLAPPRAPSLVTAFRQAGYRTYWLSTQGAAGRHETPISVLAAEADERHFINAADYRHAGALDGDLLPLLQKILDRQEPRQLIVLHTLGSHLNYAHRYPREFEQFRPALQPADTPDIWHGTALDELRNAYDNSVLYTDHVLAAAIMQIERTGAPATLLYAADHGETLFDGDCHSGGHGFKAETNYRIPMLVWTSPAWQAARAPSHAALRAHAGAPVSSLALFATMTGLAGFETSRPNGHGDLASPDWRPARRVLTFFGDFDADLKGKTCSGR